MGTLSAYAVTLMVSSAQTTSLDSPTASLALGASVLVGSRWSKQGHMQWRKTTRGGLPGGPVVKNHLPMREHGFSPRSGKIPQAARQLSPCTTTPEADVSRVCAPQQEKPRQREALAERLESPLEREDLF